jgi:hypothetical protein
MKSLLRPLHSLLKFYVEGFRNISSWGRKAWLIIIIKLFIIFAILKIFFFQDFLGKRYSKDAQKSEYVRNQILNPAGKND